MPSVPFGRRGPYREIMFVVGSVFKLWFEVNFKTSQRGDHYSSPDADALGPSLTSRRTLRLKNRARKLRSIVQS
jgi:hypothetical protein